jgi:hypothetical protein
LATMRPCAVYGKEKTVGICRKAQLRVLLDRPNDRLGGGERPPAGVAR